MSTQQEHLQLTRDIKAFILDEYDLDEQTAKPAPAARTKIEMKAPPPAPVPKRIEKVEPKPIVEPAKTPTSWKDLMAKVAPTAKMRAPAIPLLYFGGPPEGRELLDRLTSALSKKFETCERIDAISLEREGRWAVWAKDNGIRLILLVEGDLARTRHLRTFCDASKKKLFGVPYLELPRPERMAGDPALKKRVWNALCKIAPVKA